MSSLRQIKTKIKSVQSLKKITRALEIVSTVKLQKIKKKTENLRDFMEDFMSILHSVSNKVNIFDTNVDPKWRRLLIVVTSERWLCGSINSKLLKHIYSKYEDWRDKVDVFCIWKKWVEFFVRSKFNIVWSINLKEKFDSDDLNLVYSYVKKSILNKDYSKIKVYFNRFKNVMTQQPLRFKIFPLDQETFSSFAQDIDLKTDKHLNQEIKNKVLTIEPDEERFRDELINQLAEHIIFGAVLQNKAWEQASRMIAMKSATDNSWEMINSLTLTYNKARQATITQEISEIVSAKIAIWW